MSKKIVTLLLLSMVILTTMGNITHLKYNKETYNYAKTDTVLLEEKDSIALSIEQYNKQIDDSLKLDSINKTRKKGINAPVTYTAKDSLVYNANTKTAYLYGSSTTNYEDMNLESDKISLNLDSSLVRATGVYDTIKKEIVNTPIFKLGAVEYESDTLKFNFKSKKGLINNVYTAQDDGFLFSKTSKRDENGNLYLEKGRYTTCDKDCPDFYIALSRAKVRPGKDVTFGPAYLVVADVPLPLAIPYGFFPFSKRYSSGFIMPSYGDESTRGFYLRDGGYYFAINDKWDLKLLGEIYTKGSWGISAASNYAKRYKYAGTFYASYLDTRTGDKGLPDYTKQTSFKIQWSHRQDVKANPFSSLSASVNFASSSYEKSNLNSIYNPQAMTQSTRTSSVNWSTTFSSIGMTINATTNLSQNMLDTTVAITLPDINVSISRFYPFKRKQAVGKERWYEKISMSYDGQLSNSIDTKENKLFKSNLIKDWRNGMKHHIPISGNFTLFNFINITPSFDFTDRMYSNKIIRSWDKNSQKEVTDTVYGFNNVYNWSFNISASAKFYGMYLPNKKIFGDKIQAIRHVVTPTIRFSYAPDFGHRRYGYYDSYQKTDINGDVTLVEYSPYETSLFGVPGKGKSGIINFDIGNNIEMKIKSDKDSTGIKKISIIDELGASMSYNMADKQRPWSDLSVRVRLKWWKSYTFSMNAVFATYAWELDEKGTPFIGTHTEWGNGRFGRFQGFSQNISYTLTPEKLKKLFNKESKAINDDEMQDGYEDEYDTGVETNIDDVMEKGKRSARKNNNKEMAETDEDGYLLFKMPWSLSLGYGITMRENTAGTFNKKTMRYPYSIAHSLNVSGNIQISEGWNISFSSGYDFNNKKVSMTTASLSRDLHCFNMSCSIVLAPYTSYNFTFRATAATLADVLKYDKQSGYTNTIEWY